MTLGRLTLKRREPARHLRQRFNVLAIIFGLFAD
jgi:hypothetical protein